MERGERGEDARERREEEEEEKKGWEETERRAPHGQGEGQAREKGRLAAASMPRRGPHPAARLVVPFRCRSAALDILT